MLFQKLVRTALSLRSECILTMTRFSLNSEFKLIEMIMPLKIELRTKSDSVPVSIRGEASREL
jgi:hypothetical protein